MRKFNIKLFLVLMAIVAAATAGLCGAHYVQQPRIARSLLWQARRMEEKGEIRKMARFLERYLEFMPNDLAEKTNLGKAWLGETFETEPRTRFRGIDLLCQVLAKEPNQPELRTLVAKTALDPYILDTKTARDNLQVLWNDMQQALDKTNPKDRGEVESLWGRLLEAERKPVEALPWYRQAVEHAPAEEMSYLRLAYLLRTLKESNPDLAAKNGAEADALLDKLVARNELSYKAYLARWRYRRDFNQMKVEGIFNPQKIEQCAEDIKKAVERAPEEVDVLIAAADKERLLGAAKGNTKEFAEHRDEARKYLQNGLRLQAQAGYKGASEANQFQLLWHLANLQLDVTAADLVRRDDAGDKDRRDVADAAQTIEKLKANKAGLPAAAQYLEARLRLLQGQWGEAASLFTQAWPMLKDRPELQFQTDLFLAQCYERLEQPNQMYAACARALSQEPGSVAARVGMAKALWALGRMDDAIVKLEEVQSRGNVPVDELLDVARMQVQRQLIAQTPDWSKIKPPLERAENAAGNSQQPWVIVQLLRAEALAAQEKNGEAAEVLRTALQKYPKDVSLWTAWSFLTLKINPNSPSLAIDVLDEAQKRVGDDCVDLRLARAHVIVKTAQAKGNNPGDAVYATSLQKLKAGSDRFNEDDQANLLEGLAEDFYLLGKKEDARQLWTELSLLPQCRNDLRLRLMLFDVAMMADDEAGMKKVLDDMHNLERAQGSYYYLGLALKQIWLVRKGRGDRKAELNEARLQLDQVRTPMPRVALARAEVAELSGNPEEAIAHLKQAIDLGENSPKVIQRLVEALVQRQRYAEADEELHRLRDSALMRSMELRQLASDVALKQGDTARALKICLDPARDDGPNYRNLVWQARLLFVAKKDQQAFATIQEAIKQAEHEPDPRVALVQFFHARGRDLEARQAIKDAEVQITGERKALALAQCYETVGDFDRARTSYDEALTRDRGNIAVIRSVCGFYLKTGRLEEVGPLLETVVKGRVQAADGDKQWARQSLAYVLSATTDFARFREALDLVGIRLDDDGKLVRDAADEESTDAIRAKGRVLATQPQAQFRLRAIELLEQLAARNSLLPDDRFVLALLYDGQGDNFGWKKAREQLQALCLPLPAGKGERREYLNDAPRYLSRFIQGLIRHGELGDARTWLTTLESLEQQREAKPGQFGTVELQALLLEAEKRGDEALAVLRTHTGRKGAADSEVLMVVASYLRQQRFAEGFDLLDKVRDKCPPESVGGFYVSLMYGMKPTDVQCQGVETWLRAQIANREKQAEASPTQREKLAAKAGSLASQMHLAALHDLRGRYPEAEAQYKQILQAEPNNVVALNNLAWLMAQRTGDGADALQKINTAIAGMGRQSLLLDTRGLVYQALGQNDKALADFKEAAEDSPTPTILFHLARAHHLAKDRNTAADVLRQARDKGLEPAKLHPIEQARCELLMKELQMQ